MPSFPSSSLPEDVADSGPKVSARCPANFLNLTYTLPGGLRVIEDSTLWKQPDAFQATRPLILERVAKDFVDTHDPMEVQASIARYLIKERKRLKGENEKLKTMLAVMQKEKKEAQEQCIQEAKKLDLLDARYTRLEAENEGLNSKYKNAQLMAEFSKKKEEEATQRADDATRKLKEVEEAIPGQIQEAIREYQFSEDFRNEAGKDVAYCLCRFTKTYKGSNPAIVENYREFIQGYNEDWFANCNLDAPLTPEEEDEEEIILPGADQDDAQAS
ncbi:hypothetical protein LIER_27658 [Lithospermum erythrorhizon]|uniref:Uncharacterized protein n=1 Tax=Lithospermum erythrorhizon TaxID=34254 RepID=A0AAV3RCW7_LITER